MQILVIGSNGMVGRDLVRIFLREKNGEKLTFCNSDNFVNMLKIINNFDVVFNCSNNEISNLVYKKLNSSTVYIDNSSYLRENEKIPLVVPEINFVNNKIYANPNCVTIILTLFLNSIKDLDPKNIQVSTYQSLSGAGREVFKRFLHHNKYTIKNLDKVIPEANLEDNKLAFNFYPHESKKDEYGFTGEENKIMFETKKILGLDVFPTTIRVPSIRCHGESITIEFEKSTLKIDDFMERFKKHDIKFSKKIDCISSEFDEQISVGHIRQDPFNKKRWNFFVVGDQLTRGASYNAYKIYKKIVEYKE